MGQNRQRMGQKRPPKGPSEAPSDPREGQPRAQSGKDWPKRQGGGGSPPCPPRGYPWSVKNLSEIFAGFQRCRPEFFWPALGKTCPPGKVGRIFRQNRQKNGQKPQKWAKIGPKWQKLPQNGQKTPKNGKISPKIGKKPLKTPKMTKK